MFLLGTKEVGNIAGRGDKTTWQLAIFGDFNPCAELIKVQVQRTKKQLLRLMAKFIQIGKLTNGMNQHF